MSGFYVYSRHIATGKEEYINAYRTAKEAIEKIAANYKIDKDLRRLGEYFYFYKER